MQEATLNLTTATRMSRIATLHEILQLVYSFYSCTKCQHSRHTTSPLAHNTSAWCTISGNIWGGEMKCKHFTFVCPLHVRGSCLVHFGVASYIVYELQCNLQIAVPSLQGISYPLGMNFQNRTNLEIYTIKLTIIRSTFSFNKMQLCNSQNRIWRRKILLLEQENTTCAGYGKKKIRFRVLNPKFGSVSQTLTHKRP